MAESEKVLKSLLKRVKESKKDDLKLTIKKKKKKERSWPTFIGSERKQGNSSYHQLRLILLRNKMIPDVFSFKDICIYYLHILLSSKIPTLLVP